MKNAPLLLLAPLCLLAACGTNTPAGPDPVDGTEPEPSGVVAPEPDALPEPDVTAEPEPTPFVAEPQAGLTIDIEAGAVEGLADGNLRVFKGIPFAEAPIGDKRFMPPVKVEPWDGTRPAHAFGPSCPQAELGGEILVGPAGISEDCLSLNVWAHDDDVARPVMVWIYGGGFVLGSSAQPLYDAAELARRGDVVVVTINYRLGVLGWLASQALADDLGAPAAGNYGLYDQLEALRWVKTNIRAFGGDPENVTLFGESAGAISTCALLGAPDADPLFDKAIIQSGMCALSTFDQGGLIGMPSAAELAEGVVAELGCADAFNPADCLRALPVEDLLAVGSLTSIVTGDLQTVSALSPVVDGVLVPAQPIDRMRQGDVHKPIIVGSTEDEGLLFTSTDVVLTHIGLRNKIEDLLGEGPHVDALMDLYSFSDFPIAKDAWVALLGEATFICPGLEVAEAAGPEMPVYTYHFTRTPLSMAAVGVMHGLDLPYTFGTFSSMAMVPSSRDLDVSDAIMGAWSSFARHGAPSLDSGWTVYDAAAPHIAILDHERTQVDGIRDGRCAALRDLGIVY